MRGLFLLCGGNNRTAPLTPPTRTLAPASLLQSLLRCLIIVLLIANSAILGHCEDLFRQRHRTCSYQVPSVEQVVLNVPLLANNNDERGLEHPALPVGRSRLKRDSVLDRPFRPLRITLYFDPASIDPLPVYKQLFINAEHHRLMVKSSLLPQAIGFWERALLVRPSLAPIRLSRKCKSNHYYFDPREHHPSCVERCKSVATCGEVQIPDEHLFQCRYCALPNPLTCTASGPPDGKGLTGTDFLLYVSAVNSTRCENEDTIAYAAHCQQESELDRLVSGGIADGWLTICDYSGQFRPIAGHVNICPNALSTHEHDQEILLSTVKHEILHALGFSAGLYAFFRDALGRPRSKRNRYNRPLSFNRERGYYDADESTVKTVVRSDWWTADGLIPHTVHLIVTERVREEARRHFNCSKLEGAELENQGGDGTALTHWEKRLFENEAMTGTHTQNPVYSRLTLALMEDSGWYKANYEIAEPLHWGRNLGCGFAMKSCGDWIRTQLEKNNSAAPFCHDIKHDGRKSLATTRCTDQRDSLALCNLVPYKKALPMEYHNFAALSGVKKEGTRYYGGSVELADFCPYNQEFEWKAVNSSDRRDSRCELLGNAPPADSNSVMEVYGGRSRCFDLPTSWKERRCGRQKTYSQFAAGCYGFLCKSGRLHVRVANISRLYTCFYAGQSIKIQMIANGWLREGSIRCPPCDEICTKHEYWSSSVDYHHTTTSNPLSPPEQSVEGVGGDMDELSTDLFLPSGHSPSDPKCLPDSPELALFLSKGEDPLDEPCSATRHNPFVQLSVALAVLVAYVRLTSTPI